MTILRPWSSFASSWDLTIDSLLIDGQEAADVVDHGHQRIDLIRPWRDVQFDVVASTVEAPAGLKNSDVEAYALISCTRTNLRRTIELSGAVGFRGRVAIDRSTVAGPVEVVVELAAEIEGHWRSVGASTTWTLVTEQIDAPVKPGAPPFTTTWFDFTSADAPDAARRAPTAMAVMDLSAEPTLLLNRSIDGLEALLNADKAQLERRRLRDVVSASIARDAVAAMFRAAAAEVVALSEDEPTPPDNRMWRQTCSAVADEMTQVADVDELYAKLVSVGNAGGAQRAILWADIDAAIDRLTGVVEAMKRSVGEVKSV